MRQNIIPDGTSFREENALGGVVNFVGSPGDLTTEGTEITEKTF